MILRPFLKLFEPLLGQYSWPCRGGKLALAASGQSPPGTQTLLALAPAPVRFLSLPVGWRTWATPASERITACATGARANGIGSADIVESMSRAGMVGFFGAAGLSVQRTEAAIERIQKNLGDAPSGFNLIHSPTEPALENAVVDLYLRRGSASGVTR